MAASTNKKRSKGKKRQYKPTQLSNIHKPLDMTVEQWQTGLRRQIAEKTDLKYSNIGRWRKMGFLSEEDRQRLMISLNMMRMACNSTYIFDQETNHQTKLDELFSILDEVIATGDEKIVIFSQWERFTRLIASELDNQKIGYANLNGSVSSKKRKELFDRFNNDDNCRIFLSTDAGGVGLNLQAGSLLFNMDFALEPGSAGAAHRPHIQARAKKECQHYQLYSAKYYRAWHVIQVKVQESIGRRDIG